MPLPVADLNKKPVIFVDVLSAMLADLHRAFDVLFVLTSNVSQGRSREEMLSTLTLAGLPCVADNLHAEWATPYARGADVGEQVEAWHATVVDRTPTSYLIVTTAEHRQHLGHILRDYAVAFDDPVISDETYLDACRILHSQTSFASFNADWY